MTATAKNLERTKRKEAKLSPEAARALFIYEPTTGKLINRATRRGALAGKEAGTITGKGYRKVRINGLLFPAHRLAWCVHYGEWPSVEIDHHDGNRANNALANLREAHPSQNRANTGIRSTNTSGRIGVHFYKPLSKWMAYATYTDSVTGERVRKHLGYYDDKLEAAASRDDFVRVHHGAFAVHSDGTRTTI